MNMRKQIGLLLALGTICAFAVSGAAQTAGKRHVRQKSPARSQVMPIGIWGGPEVILTVQDAGTTVEFPCAQGSIASRLRVDQNGAFRVAGTYTRRSPGPTLAAGGQGPGPVTYVGKIKGNTLRLTIHFSTAAEKDLSFLLEKGKIDDRFTRCY